MVSKQRVSCSLDMWGLSLLLLLLLLVQLAAAQKVDCPHECIPLTECPELGRLLDNPNPKDIKILQDATCSIRRKIPTVCCSESTTNPPTSPKPTLPRLTSLLPQICGLGPELDRILGGTEAPINGYPWMAVLGYLDRGSGSVKFQCGGSVINERYVLTAAHCVHPSVLSAYPLDVIRLGEWDLNSEIDCDVNLLGFKTCLPPAQNFTYEEITLHPDYNTRSIISDDIALIRLSRPIDLSGKSVQAVCLPPQNLEPRSIIGTRQAVVAGWGITENGTTSDKLLHVSLPIVDHASCDASYNGALLDEQICFGGRLLEDSCKGDSGGPLLLSGPHGPPFLQIGIVSFGPKQCGIENKPGVYTSVSYYRNWIERTLKP